MEAQFYVVQKAFIRKGIELLILNDPAEGLDYPGGKIQIGETDLVESLKREVREETGLEISIGEPFATWSEAGFFLVAYRCEYVSGEIKLSNEHNNFSWVNKDNFTKVDDGTSFFELLKKYFS
jgi:8-oxo-dGTP pyrophosphatase MutT (NUDIX family)